MPRRAFPSSLAALLPALLLAGCGEPAPPPEPPLTAAALEAVAEEPGVDREKLARAIDALFTRDGIGETRAVDRDARGRSRRRALRRGLRAGDAVRRLVDVEDRDRRADRACWSPTAGCGSTIRRRSRNWQRAGDPRGEITLRQLLQMRSGLRHEEKAEPVYTSPEVRMMFLDGRDDMAGWAEAQPLESEPGREFDYSTPTDDDPRRHRRAGARAERQRCRARGAAVAEYLRARLVGAARDGLAGRRVRPRGHDDRRQHDLGDRARLGQVRRVPAPQGLGRAARSSCRAGGSSS